MEDNNLDGKIAYLRDTFLKAQKEYLDELMKQSEWKKYVEALNKLDAKKLAVFALRRIESIENGEVKEEDLESVETEITLVLAAIQDCARERGAKEKAKHVDNQKDIDDEFEK